MRKIKEKGAVDLQVHSPPREKGKEGKWVQRGLSPSSLTQWLLNPDRDHLQMITELH